MLYPVPSVEGPTLEPLPGLEFGILQITALAGSTHSAASLCAPHGISGRLFKAPQAQCVHASTDIISAKQQLRRARPSSGAKGSPHSKFCRLLPAPVISPAWDVVRRVLADRCMLERAPRSLTAEQTGYRSLLACFDRVPSFTLARRFGLQQHRPH